MTQNVAKPLFKACGISNSVTSYQILSSRQSSNISERKEVKFPIHKGPQFAITLSQISTIYDNPLYFFNICLKNNLPSTHRSFNVVSSFETSQPKYCVFFRHPLMCSDGNYWARSLDCRYGGPPPSTRSVVNCHK
jgi:hypothetical protein